MKFTLFLFVLTLFSYGFVRALPQAPGVSATTSMPTASTANGGSDNQNLRGAPCRGPPAVGQYRLSGFLTANKK